MNFYHTDTLQKIDIDPEENDSSDILVVVSSLPRETNKKTKKPHR